MLKEYSSIYLMLGDTPICYINFDDVVLEVLRGELLPYALRKDFYALDNTPTSLIKCFTTLKSWLASRVIAMSLDNYKQLMTYFNLVQTSDIDYKVKVAINCRAISVEDAYWIKYDGEGTRWSSVNPNTNSLSDIVSISLSSNIPSITGDLNHPNINMDGTFPKTWLRKGNTLMLLKTGKTSDDINVKVEITASNFFNCIKRGTIGKVMYTPVTIHTDDGEIPCSICVSYYLEGYSVVKAQELIEYMGIDKFKSWIHEDLSREKYISNMIVLDYLMANTDRHTDNYGFYMDNSTGDIVSCVPLYDFNYCFISDFFGKSIDDILCQTFNDGPSIIDIVTEYAPYCDIKLGDVQLHNFLWENSVLECGVTERIKTVESIIGHSLICKTNSFSTLASLHE